MLHSEFGNDTGWYNVQIGHISFDEAADQEEVHEMLGEMMNMTKGDIDSMITKAAVTGEAIASKDGQKVRLTAAPFPVQSIRAARDLEPLVA